MKKYNQRTYFFVDADMVWFSDIEIDKKKVNFFVSEGLISEFPQIVLGDLYTLSFPLPTQLYLGYQNTALEQFIIDN